MKKISIVSKGSNSRSCDLSLKEEICLSYSFFNPWVLLFTKRSALQFKLVVWPNLCQWCQLYIMAIDIIHYMEIMSSYSWERDNFRLSKTAKTKIKIIPTCDATSESLVGILPTFEGTSHNVQKKNSCRRLVQF